MRFGYVDAEGRRHRDGVIRAARARDEMAALRDFRVYLRPRSFLAVMLARTVESLGELESVEVGTFDRLREGDLDLLESLYRELNGYALVESVTAVVDEVGRVGSRS